MERNPEGLPDREPRMRYLPAQRSMGDLVADLSLQSTTNGPSTDTLDVIVTPTLLIVQRIAWSPYGGPATDCAPTGPARIGPLHGPHPLAALLRPEEERAIDPAARRWADALIERRRAWSAEQWRAACFAHCMPMREDGMSRHVPAEQADWFELATGVATSRGVELTLRLGRTTDQLIDDHGYHFNDSARTVEVRASFDAGTPEGRATVAAALGDQVADMAWWFAQDRAGRFCG